VRLAVTTFAKSLRSCLLGLILAWPVLHADPTRAADLDVVDLTNAIRASGCGDLPGAAALLRSDPRLQATAQRMSTGTDFEAALRASDYRASTATVLEIEAQSGPAAVRGFLEGRFCPSVVNPDFRDMGVASRGREFWIVLAAPLEFPDEHERAAVAERVLELTNQARARARSCGNREFPPAPPVAAASLLDAAAQRHADDMAARNALTHTGSDGSSVRERVSGAGYAWRAVAENIAEGQPTAYVVVRDWLESPEHCANLMDPAYTQMGIAFAVSDEGAGQSYWVQVFAAPR
jgi:uncharacterized protein YkwD